MVKRKSTSQNQTMLTALFLAVMLSGFAGVMYAQTQYNSVREPIPLYSTDANTVFGVMQESDPTYIDIQTAQYMIKDGGMFQYNRTPVSLGNDTYAIAVNSTDGHRNFVQYMVEMPNIQNWIIDTTNISISLNGDTDLEVIVAIYHVPNNIYVGGDSSMSTLLYKELITSGESVLDLNLDIDTTTALSINQLTQSRDCYLLIQVQDMAFNGLSAFSFSLKAEISGEIITSWSLENTITSILIISTIGNVIVGVVMIDNIDIGGYVKTLQKRRR